MRDKNKKSVYDNMAEMIDDPNTPLDVKVKLIEMRTNLETNRRQNYHERTLRRMKDKPDKQEEKRERARERLDEPSTIPLGERVNSILEEMNAEAKGNGVTQ